MRATHGTNAVGVTNRPVASPATDWATEIQSAATCLTGLPTAKWPATMPVATKRYRDCRTPCRRLLSIAFETRCNSRHQLARYASRHQVDDPGSLIPEASPAPDYIPLAAASRGGFYGQMAFMRQASNERSAARPPRA